MDRRGYRALLVSVLLLTGISANAQMDQYSIKAGYLYNFSKYVVWPTSVFATPDAPFVICLAGEDPFGGRLDQVIAGKTSADSRPFVVKHLKAADRDAFRECQVVFVSKSEQDHAAEILDMIKDSAVFTVADFDLFAQKGGIADLRIEGSRVKVDLNVTAANRVNLKISARLQQVANLVH